MLTVEILEEYGADVRAGLSRCMNNENLYLRLVGMAVEEPAIASLGEALQAGDLNKAFEESHKLNSRVWVIVYPLETKIIVHVVRLQQSSYLALVYLSVHSVQTAVHHSQPHFLFRVFHVIVPRE